jgi:hypothetical protein
VESAGAKREMLLNCLSMVVDGREVDDGDCSICACGLEREREDEFELGESLLNGSKAGLDK